jgi:hypothetical protein
MAVEQAIELCCRASVIQGRFRYYLLQEIRQYHLLPLDRERLERTALKVEVGKKLMTSHNPHTSSL